MKQSGFYKPTKDSKGNIVNSKTQKILPPKVDNNQVYGKLTIELGEIFWLNYDKSNYLEDVHKGCACKQPKVCALYAVINFWGESGDKFNPPIYLKFQNGLRPALEESATTSYTYNICSPENIFERYLDDMGNTFAIDLYDAQIGHIIGKSVNISPSLFIKRRKKIGDNAPLLEMRNQKYGITLIGDQFVKIGEFQITLMAEFKSSQTQFNQTLISHTGSITSKDNSRLVIDLNEETFEADRIAASLKKLDKPYQRNNFEGGLETEESFVLERPTRDRPKSHIQNSNTDVSARSINLKPHSKPADFSQRKQLDIDENEDTIQDFKKILERGERLKQQMEEALTDAAWEQIHGPHHIPKTYVPPFLKTEIEQKKQQNFDLSEIDTFIPNIEDQKLQLKQEQTLNEEHRQLMLMHYIYLKIKQVSLFDEDVLQSVINNGIGLNIQLPLPDSKFGKISQQAIKLCTYEPGLEFNEFIFNSTNAFNFKLAEQTIAQFVQSEINIEVDTGNEKIGKPQGVLTMKKLIMAKNFQIQGHIDLYLDLSNKYIHTKANKKDNLKHLDDEKRHVGVVTFDLNLQSENSEEIARRNFEIKMQEAEAARATQEQLRQEKAKQRLQFIMDQAPVFGQLYLHIEKLGRSDEIGHRSPEEIQASQDNQLLNESLNDRLDFQQVKRNFFIQYKAFPNLEKLKTSTVWQQDEESEFGYKAQFPVIMSPETLEKMERFILVLELWDKISPSREEFLGMVKIPLSPICFSMRTTDQEVYSLNFMADQFCLYPMIVADGFQPIYSPKLGKEIGHLKITLAMGSPVQVNRLLQKDKEREDKEKAEKERIKIIEIERQKELEIIEIRRKEEEQRRILEEERKKSEEESQMLTLLGGGKRPGTGSKNIAALLRQSMGSDANKGDYDQRSRSMLNAMRKLFEEARSQGFEELNGETLFKDEVKNFDGTVSKDEVLYALLNSEQFSLTRTEVASITTLMMDINRNDLGRFDVDELHFSYRSYIKYYEIVEQRILDLLDKFKITIEKKFNYDVDQLYKLTSELQSRAQDCKLPLIELREVLEDRNGITIRDALFDQLASYFDLDRDGKIYIISFCEYLKQPSSQNINFFKVNHQLIGGQIADFIKNSIESGPIDTDLLHKLEQEFKDEIWKTAKHKKIRELHDQNRQAAEDDSDGKANEEDLEIIPADLLITEKINAKLFQFKLKRIGIALSLWEVFTLFEQLNIDRAKMFFEPQRYHQIMFGTFYQFIRNQNYDRGSVRQATKSKIRSPVKDRSQSQIYDVQKHGYSKNPLLSDDNEDEGYLHKNDESEDEDPRRPYEQVKHIFEIKVKELKNIPLLNKLLQQLQNDHDFQESKGELNTKAQRELQKTKHLQANKYIQNVAVKYSFPLDEDEILESDFLQLNNEALQQQGTYNYQVSMDTVHTYVVGKKDSIQKVLELCQSRGAAVAIQEDRVAGGGQQRREELFNLSIALYQDNREFIIGNAHLPIEDLIETIDQFKSKTGTYQRNTRKTLMQRTLFLYGTTYSQRENCIIGKLQLEVQYSQEKLFLSKREAKAFATAQAEQKAKGKEGELLINSNNPLNCFMHRETYVNRKIPLNAKLSVLIDRVHNLKESIENIEHFAKIQHSALGAAREQSRFEAGLDGDGNFDSMLGQGLNDLSMSTMVQNKKDMQHLDRRRVLKHILKNGLNLVVLCSIFEEDQELVQKFELKKSVVSQVGNLSKYQTRMLYNSLNPVFGEVFELNVQMNTKIFEYLKNKRAVFEIRHYIIQSQKQKIQTLRQSGVRASQNISGDFNARDGLYEEEGIDTQRTIGDDDVKEACDYLILGHVRVPLLQLITKNNGVDGEFSILDEFKQNMGSLKLRITLNHHNSQRPLYSNSSKIPNQITPHINQQSKRQTLIEHSISIGLKPKEFLKNQQDYKMILGIDFIELILKNRKQLTQIHLPTETIYSEPLTARFFLKYRLLNQNYQTKFLVAENGQALSPLNILLSKLGIQTLRIAKAHFLEIDLSDLNQIEQAFGKPLEIQLWYKLESIRAYERPIKEELVGSFFVEINELTKTPNRRLKDPDADTGGRGSPGRLQVFEGYFSMHDTKEDQLSQDRLGMRLLLVRKDENNDNLTVNSMNQIFNIYRNGIENQLANQLDTQAKGYVECEDLVALVKQQIRDDYLSQKVIWFIKASLEFKDVNKVFYSPLFGLPPPFFKSAKKFDTLDILVRIHNELEALDSSDHGFIAVNLFRNCLEGELKIKSKIVDDLINGLRDLALENSNEMSVTHVVKEQRSLDIHLVTNSLKTSHVDFIVLVRKLAASLEQGVMGSFPKTSSALINESVKIQARQIEAAQEVSLFFEVDNGMRIRNPLNPIEPPTCFVVMKPDFQSKEVQDGQILQTNDVRSNAYPTWNYRSPNFTLPLNQANCEFLEQGGILKFEVFHKAASLTSAGMTLQEGNHLVGVAFVPLSNLIEGKGKTRMTGLYDIVSKTNLYNQSIGDLRKSPSINLDSDQGPCVGKIKISISASTNIRKIMDSPTQPKILEVNDVYQNPDTIFAEKILTSNNLSNKYVSFGGRTVTPTGSRKMEYLKDSYSNNPYPSSPQKQRVEDFSGPQKIRREDFSGSQSFTKMDESVRDYHYNLQGKSNEELDNLHKFNMKDLDDLNKKLKESLTVLNIQVPDSNREISPEISVRTQKANDFGRQTVKTDYGQLTMSQDLQRFRELRDQALEQYAQKMATISNPFASIDRDNELERAVEFAKEIIDPSRGQEETEEMNSQNTQPVAQISQIVNYENAGQLGIPDREDLISNDEESPRFNKTHPHQFMGSTLGDHERHNPVDTIGSDMEQVLSVFRKQNYQEPAFGESSDRSKKSRKLEIDGIEFDEDEMKRIEKILRQ